MEEPELNATINPDGNISKSSLTFTAATYSTRGNGI